MNIFEANKLTPENFKDYGYIISKESSVPLFNNENFTYWNILPNFKFNETVSIGIVTGNKEDIVISAVERHSSTSEILIALKGDALVLLGKSLLAFKAFYLEQGETIILHPGIWHSTPIPVNKKCELLVMFSSDTIETDLEVQNLPEGNKISF